jgi:hypothetical protein
MSIDDVCREAFDAVHRVERDSGFVLEDSKASLEISFLQKLLNEPDDTGKENTGNSLHDKLN